MENKPLRGRGIVVTRPRELAAALARGIEDAGGQAIVFPTIEIADAPPPAALQRLDAYQLAIFVSPTAVRKVMAQLGGWPGRLPAAAIGAGSKRELERHGVREVLAPEAGADSEALLAVPALQRMQGKRVVIFRGGAGRPLLGEALAARGALVEYADCYRRVASRADPAPLLAQWNAVHAVTISSSEGLDNLVALTGAARLSAKPMFVPHERVAGRAREHGIGEVVITGSGDDGVLERLVAYFR